MRIMITGQRPHHLRFEHRAWLIGEIPAALERLHGAGFDSIACGMAVGFDQWVAIQAVKQGFALDAFLPFPAEHQSSRWDRDQRALYSRLLKQARSTTIEQMDPYTSSGSFDLGAYHRRNMAMAMASDGALIGWNGTSRSGGTWHGIGCVISRQLNALLLHAGDREVRAFKPAALAVRVGMVEHAAA